ncbi:MAG: hypothetical protein IMHGJWDQ_001450 [Candidatus Fervidibacter sp.]
MYRLILLGMLMVGLWVMSSSPVVQNKSQKWSLNGNEILLQLDSLDSKYPSGIYACDPFGPDKKFHLLVPGGERPVWHPKRKFFAYLKGQSLCFANYQGKEMEYSNSFGDSDLNFYDPIVIWSYQKGNMTNFAIIERNSPFGSLVYLETLVDKKILQGKVEYADVHAGVFIVPIPQQVKEKKMLVKSVDLLTTNNPTFSPDGKYMAAEVYPAGMDLRRYQSRIMVFRFPEAQEEPDLSSFFLAAVFAGPGRRLTSLTGNNCELMPIWSPTGEWIAFTFVDLDSGFVAPVVVRPNGSDMTMLLPKEMMTTWPSDKWRPIGTWLAKAWDERPSPPCDWGFPHITPVEWSPDGKIFASQ